MSKLLFAAILPLALLGQPANILTQQTGSVDLGGASSVRPFVVGLFASMPAACTVGQFYYATDKTSDSRLYHCTTTGNPGTWAVYSGGGTTPAGLSPILTGMVYGNGATYGAVTGTARQALRVNAAGNAFEFSSPNYVNPADYTSGTTAGIQAAIDASGAEKAIVLGPGTHVINSQVTVANDGGKFVSIEGISRAATKVKCRPTTGQAANSACFWFGNSATDPNRGRGSIGRLTLDLGGDITASDGGSPVVFTATAHGWPIGSKFPIHFMIDQPVPSEWNGLLAQDWEGTALTVNTIQISFNASGLSFPSQRMHYSVVADAIGTDSVNGSTSFADDLVIFGGRNAFRLEANANSVHITNFYALDQYASCIDVTTGEGTPGQLDHKWGGNHWIEQGTCTQRTALTTPGYAFTPSGAGVWFKSSRVGDAGPLQVNHIAIFGNWLKGGYYVETTVTTRRNMFLICTECIAEIYQPGADGCTVKNGGDVHFANSWCMSNPTMAGDSGHGLRLENAFDVHPVGTTVYSKSLGDVGFYSPVSDSSFFGNKFTGPVYPYYFDAGGSSYSNIKYGGNNERRGAGNITNNSTALARSMNPPTDAGGFVLGRVNTVFEDTGYNAWKFCNATAGNLCKYFRVNNQGNFEFLNNSFQSVFQVSETGPKLTWVNGPGNLGSAATAGAGALVVCSGCSKGGGTCSSGSSIVVAISTGSWWECP